MIARTKLLQLADILPTEEVDPNRLAQVSAMILRRGFWTRPIVIEEKSHAIMDGHHRFESASALGFQYVPVILLSYDRVRVEPRRVGLHVTSHEIVRRANLGLLYPPKSTRHFFPGKLPVCHILFEELRVKSGWNERCLAVWSAEAMRNSIPMVATA